MSKPKIRKAKFIKLAKPGITMSIRHNENVPRRYDHILQFSTEDIFNILASIIFGDQISDFPIYEYSYDDLAPTGLYLVRQYKKYNLVTEQYEEISFNDMLQLKDIYSIAKAIDNNIFPFDLVPQIKIETNITAKPCMYVIFDYVDFMMNLIENVHPRFTYRDNIINHATREFNTTFNNLINLCNAKMQLTAIPS